MERSIKGGWLKAYKNYIVKQESPDIFHLWVGMQMISASLKRNVFIDRGAYKIYPNQYVFLIAKSGMCRKSVAMDIGLDLLSSADDIHIIHERTTVEGLMDKMKRQTVRKSDNKIVHDGSIVIHADELANLFGKSTYVTDLISFLTSAYSGRGKLEFVTRNKGVCSVRNPCPLLLAGTTPDQMGVIFPSATLFSGFMARVILIVGESGKRVAEPCIKTEMRDALIHDLNCITYLCAEMLMSDDANAMYVDWYESMQMPKHRELEGFYQRKHDHVLKAALIFSISESNELIMTKDHLITAIAAIEDVEARIPTAINHIGATVQSDIGDVIEGIIRSRSPFPVLHSHLLSIIRRRVRDADEFKSIINTLIEAGRICADAGKTGIHYTLNKGRHDEDR